MLSYALAIAVAISSFGLFLTAFLMSDIHRKDDFLWSGVGLFYALVLWFCARNITGAVLLGQASASILLISFVWQTLKLRKAIANPEKAAEINNFSVLQAINGLSKGKKSRMQAPVAPPVTESADVVTESKISIPQSTSSRTESSLPNSNVSQKKASKFGSFGKMFGSKKKSTITNTKLDDILEDDEVIAPETTKPQTAVTDVRPVADPISNESSDNIAAKSLNKVPEKEELETQITEKIAENNQAVEEEIKEKVINTPEIVQPEKPVAAEKNVAIQEPKLDTPVLETPVTLEPEVPSENIDKELPLPEEKAEPETALTNNVVQTDVIEADNINPIEVSSEAEKTAPETTKEIKEQPKTNPSSALDSLETVEVAEVLEARPEDMPNDRDSDRSDIIEVTTTEINQELESKQSDQDLNQEKT